MSLRFLLCAAAVLAPLAAAQSPDLEMLGDRVLAEANERVRARKAEQQHNAEFVGDPTEGRITIQARDASFAVLVNDVARKCRPPRNVVGLDELSRDPLVSARMVGVEVDDALRWIGGSVGLRVRVGATRIEVAEELPPYPRRSDLFGRARDAWLMATIRHNESPEAPRASMFIAEIEAMEEVRAGSAARRYLQITEDYPDSDLVPEAYFEAGRNFARAGEWSQALQVFDDLSSYLKPHPYRVEARRWLAECHAQLAAEAVNDLTRRSSAQNALLVLDRLDDSFPPNDNAERFARLVIRSRAYSLADRPEDALKALDLAAAASQYGDRDPELMELRAMALDRGARYDDAFRAWMRHAQQTAIEERGPIYSKAAASANSARSHVAAILTWHTARNEGLGSYVDGEYQIALVALGLDMDVRADRFGDRQQIAAAELFFDTRRFEAAVDLLRPVYDRRIHLEDRRDRQRLVLLYAQALEEAKRMEEAIHVLRESAQEFEHVSSRRAIYQLASKIFERAGDLERAIAALSGTL